MRINRILACGLSSAIAAVLFCTTAAADAQPTEPLHWDCVQRHDAEFNVLCQIRDGLALTVSETGNAPSTFALPEPRPGYPDMRPVSQRGAIADFAPDPWKVPLHSAPTDPHFVRQLLESVLCGTRPACHVGYREGGALVARR